MENKSVCYQVSSALKDKKMFYRNGKTKKISILVFLYFLALGNLYSQTGGNIQGAINVAQYSYESYTLSPWGQLSQPAQWQVNDGVIVSSNGLQAGVEWDVAGVQQLKVTYTNTLSESFSLSLFVTVQAAPTPTTPLPPVPETPFVLSLGCGTTTLPVIQRVGEPTHSTYIWYWQGKSYSGTSKVHSGLTYTADQGSGNYYIRAYNYDNDTWSQNSASVYITIQQPTVWYADNDIDGFGDPNITLLSCLQPDGYVGNNTDVCPDRSGYNSGCPTYTISDENYIHSIVPKIPVTNLNQITQTKDKMEKITYFDGLGRPIQNINIHDGGANEDVITNIEYDNFGRETKQYLPYAIATEGGSFRTGDISLVTKYFYNTPKYQNTLNPYSEKDITPSPLNRVKRQAAPGNAWAMDTGHEVKFGYASNESEHNVRFLTVTASDPVTGSELYTTALDDNGYYVTGELNKNTIADENGNTIYEYMNRQGQLVLKRAIDGLTQYNTYYIYDQFGNLSFVMPPLVDTSQPITNTILDGLCYQYKYDHRNRLIEKKLPGKGWEYLIYDKLDRILLAQEENLRLQNKWLFTKYDAFGRVIYTGEYTDARSRAEIQMEQSAATVPLWEVRNASAVVVGDASLFYTNSAFPSANIKLFTVNYYDSYVDHSGITLPSSVYGVLRATNVKSLPTVSKIRTLGTTQWTTNVQVYDKKARQIWSRSVNPTLATNDIIESKLDFTGKLLESRATHTKTGSVAGLVTTDYYTYDHADRLLRHMQKIGKNAEHLIAFNSYDELGKLIEKKIGNRWTNFSSVGMNTEYGYHRKEDTNEDWNTGKIWTDEFIDADNGNVTFLVDIRGPGMKMGIIPETDPEKINHEFIDYAIEFTTDVNERGQYNVRVHEGLIDHGVQTYFDHNDQFTIEIKHGNVFFLKNREVFFELKNSYPESRFIPLGAFLKPDSIVRDVAIHNYDYPMAYQLEKIRYDYNVRGWLKGINKPTPAVPSPSELFSFEINYDSPTNGAQPLYNGNISQTSWRSKNNNSWKNYGYTYDPINRLTAASFKNPSVPAQNNNFAENVTYDANGNIKTMERSGDVVSFPASANMDAMTYFYNGNQLIRIKEGGQTGAGFITAVSSSVTTDQYVYDTNGNMTADLNKGIGNLTQPGIVYNHLNLPTEITFNGNANTKINYTYDATGRKLRKTVKNGANTTIADYCGSYQYSKLNTATATLDMIVQPEGYVSLSSANATESGVYTFQYKDHLGNVRLSYSDTNKNAEIALSEVIEENAYYPFGLKHSGGVINGGGNAVAQKYKYNGKEFQDELGLNMTAMDYRQYDNAIGRFLGIDKLAELSYSMTPYRFAYNNPVYWTDPTGLFENTSENLEHCPTCPNTPVFKPLIDDPNNEYVYDRGTNTVTLVTELEEVVVENSSRNSSRNSPWFYIHEGFGLWGSNRYGDLGGHRNGTRKHSIEAGEIPGIGGSARSVRGSTKNWGWLERLFSFFKGGNDVGQRIGTIQTIIENNNTSTMEVQHIEPVAPPPQAVEIIIPVVQQDTASQILQYWKDGQHHGGSGFGTKAGRLRALEKAKQEMKENPSLDSIQVIPTYNK